MLPKILAWALLTFTCVIAVPLKSAPPGHSYAVVHRLTGEHRSPIHEDHHTLLSVSHIGDVKNDSADTTEGKRRGKKSSGGSKQPGDTDAGKEESSHHDAPKTPEKEDGKTSPKDATKPPTNGKQPGDGATSDNGAPQTEPEQRVSPSASEHPRPTTGPAKSGEKKPPSSVNSPSDGKAPNTPDMPKDTNTPATGKEKPEFVPDGEGEVDGNITPAGVIGGVTAGVALLAAAFVAWSRRSVNQSQSYEPVQADEIDVDGWNDGWDDGWDEGTSTKT